MRAGDRLRAHPHVPKRADEHRDVGSLDHPERRECHRDVPRR